MSDDALLDPSLLEGLTDEQRQEAMAAAAAAKRAEARAEQRALERAMKQREEERERQRRQEQSALAAQSSSSMMKQKNPNNNGDKIVFVSKRRRNLQQQQEHGNETRQAPQTDDNSRQLKAPQKVNNDGHGNSASANGVDASSRTNGRFQSSFTGDGNDASYSSAWTNKELRAVKEMYLGKSSLPTDQEKNNDEGRGDATRGRGGDNRNSKRGNNKQSSNKAARSNKKITFRFEWDDKDDTLDDGDPLYSSINPAMGSRQQHHENDNGRRRPGGRNGGSHNGRHGTSYSRGASGSSGGNRRKKRGIDDLDDDYSNGSGRSLHVKPIDKMTSRDWRIFRENYEIVVRGGRAPPPLRSFRECPSPNEIPELHPALLDAVENVMHYKEPTPIQRQAIPIGLQRRDMIGIAETGSGKTCAFGLPVLQYILYLPQHILNRVADDGPLALVIGPTRELAIQIYGEFQKLLSRQSQIKACVVVGGQNITQQAQQIREGVHIVVGTPGRINDCIEMAYLVLNQCCYIVLDEADRMIDMGFAPQIKNILDAMGGMLKSENESEAYQQEQEDLKNLMGGPKSLPRHRLTAMFSATMPLEVEKLAKQYMRHPAVVSIGDQDSSKNARIVQRVIFLSSPSQKESALRDLLLQPKYLREKVIVFVNEKKHADGVGRMVERIGRQCVVLHGGKSQEQREENLETFRRGGVVLVATDVAGRGLDIPDVAHVINFDVPSRSIEAYTHRIGRTGRAGKEGLATSLITDQDEGIMAALKSYLESTNNPVPDRLARHPAASAVTQGNVIH